MIDWADRPATVASVSVGLTDDVLIEMIQRADKVGIDAPFGWPDDFVAAVARHSRRELWPEATIAELRYRLTDRLVAGRARRPLSVSSDLIAVTAMRCARLLSALEQDGNRVDRAGAGKVAEVYPAAALVVWGFDPTGYKRSGGISKRKALVAGLGTATNGWLRVSAEVRAVCVASDDAFDALIASLVARAAAAGLTENPSGRDLEQARREGWIHLPVTGSLSSLGE